MPRKRPTEASWDSDEDLLQDTAGVSAFSSKKDGEDIDEDALLGLDSADASLAELSAEIEIGLDSSDVIGFNDSADTQELDYEDTVQEESEFTIEDPMQDTGTSSQDGGTDSDGTLVVDGQPNFSSTIFTSAQPVMELSAPGNDSDSDNEDKNSRSRFRTERQTITSKTSYPKSSHIPDTLVFTEDMQAEIDSFDSKKGRGKQRNRQQQQQHFQQRNGPGGQPRYQNPRNIGIANRLGPRQGMMFHRAPNNGPMRQRGPQQDFQGPRGSLQHMNMGPRGPRPEFQSPPRGPPQGPRGPQQQFQSPIGSPSGPARFPHELVGQRSTYAGPPGSAPSHIPQPQPLLPSPVQPMIHHPAPQQIQHTPHQVPYTPAPNPHPPATAIHVNPNFHGQLPSNIQGQPNIGPAPPAHSVPQPLFSQSPQQPQPQFQAPQSSWSHQQPHIPASYSQTPHHQTPHHQTPQHQAPHHQAPHHPTPQHQGMQHQGPPNQGPGMLPTPRPGYPPNMGPGLLGSPRQPQPQHIRPGFQSQPSAGVGNQGQVRQPFNQQHFNNNMPRQNFMPRGSTLQQQNPRMGPQQPRPPRPLANQRPQLNRHPGPRGSQQGQFRPRLQQQNPRFKPPELLPREEPGWNPDPVNLANQQEPIDPEKIQKQQEMEERKKKRLQRFGGTVPVEVKVESSKVVTLKPVKRASSEEVGNEEVSPAKTIKIEPFSSVKSEAKKQLSDYERALEDQKERRAKILQQKEAHRQADANRRRLLLKQKLAKEGKTLADLADPVVDESPPTPQNKPQQNPQFSHHQGQGQFQQHTQGQFQGQSQNEQFNQFHNNRGRGGGGNNRGQFGNRGHGIQGQMGNRGRGVQGQIGNRGQTSRRGQPSNRGQGMRNEGQPISVVGQNQQKISTVGRGQGRGRGGNLRGRGGQKVPNFGQLQQVHIEENIDYESYDSIEHVPATSNRTVIPEDMNAMGAASHGYNDRMVIAGNPGIQSPRRIVLDSKNNISSTVSIEGLPNTADIGKLNTHCAKFGTVKVFNYLPAERRVIVQFNDSSEANGFLKKNTRFMFDITMLSAKTIPEV